MEPQVIFGISVFTICFILISSDKSVRPSPRWVVRDDLPCNLNYLSERAFEEVDWNVVFLLINMMLVMKHYKGVGLQNIIAIKMAKIAKGSPFGIIFLLPYAAVFSAFLDNVTTVLILTPITILIAVELGLSPIPFIYKVMANIGGTATLIGDLNIMIGSTAHLSFLSFIRPLSPVIVLILAFTASGFTSSGEKTCTSQTRKNLDHGIR